MTNGPVVRMRRSLLESLPDPVWPDGVSRGTFFDPACDAPALHALLADAYRHGGGAVAPFPVWWAALQADDEYDPALCILARTTAGEIVGAAQCWTSGYIKDLGVRGDWRRKGIGTALLFRVFALFRDRGLSTVDLKVESDNPSRAMQLYEQAGMRAVSPQV